MNVTAKATIRTYVRSGYDLQKLRIQMGNRIVAQFKSKLGQPPSVSEEDSLGEEEQTILADLRASHKKLTDGVKNFPKQSDFKGDELISSYTELCLLDQYISLEKSEASQFRRLGNVLSDYPIFTEFLDKVKGIGPAMAGVIISEIDITKAKYPSSLWAYAGLDVAGDGKGRSRREEHLVEREYTTKDGAQSTRMGVTYNPWLRTKLMGVLASSFLRCKDSPYADIYRAYKHRLENHAVYGIANDAARIAQVKAEKGHKYAPKGHRHAMALRYAVKRFLVDLYINWRKLEGLPVAPEYSEAKLGMKHSA